MPVRELIQLLAAQNVRYEVIPHVRAFTAQGTAALSHVSGNQMAKAVILKADEKLVMAVVPASRRVEVDVARKAIGANTVAIASEAEFKDRFPGCETGAMPPFGQLYGMEIFIDESLSRCNEIVFNGGSHREMVRISYEDFARLAAGKVAHLSAELHAIAA